MTISRGSIIGGQTLAERVAERLGSCCLSREVLVELEYQATPASTKALEDLPLSYRVRTLQARQPLSLRVCTLLDRSVRRIVDLPMAFRGFDIPDRFVVGYGLDYHQRYRNLPFIGVLKPEILEPRRRP